MQRVRVTAAGRVQGVFFRASVAEEARRRGVSGWVRNTGDGRVEAEFQGPDPDVDALVELCRRGPGQSQVSTVDVEPAGIVPDAHGFDVR